MALVYRLENRCIVLVSQRHVEYEEGLQVFSAAIAQAQASQFASWQLLFTLWPLRRIAPKRSCTE
jgi:hypothetical protein